MKYSEKNEFVKQMWWGLVPLLNFEGGPRVPLLILEEGSGLPLLNFSGVSRPTFKLWGGSRGPRSRGPGPTFTPWHVKHSYSG